MVESTDTRSTLIVDDDRMILKILKRMLPLAGINQIEIAEGGLEACSLLRDQHFNPDIILCDLQMPGLDGIGFLHEAVQLGYKGEIVLMSGGDSQEVLETADAFAKDHHLTILGTLVKPVTIEGLKAVFNPG